MSKSERGFIQQIDPRSFFKPERDLTMSEIKHLGVVAKLFHEIITENDNLSTLMKSISYGKMSSDGCYSNLGNLKISAPILNTDSYQLSYDGNEPFSAIRIADFTARNINTRSMFSVRDTTERSYYRRIYNLYWKTENQRFGINVCKTAVTKGYSLNFTDVRKLMVTTSQHNARYSDTTESSINEFYFVGSKNCLLAVSSCNSILFIRQQTLAKLIDNNELPVVKRCLKNLLVCFNQTNLKYTEMNVKVFKDDIAEITTENALNKIVNSDLLDSRYYRMAGVESSIQEYEQLMQRIHSYAKEVIDSAIGKTIFGADDKYSYSRLINQILEMKKEHITEVYNNGFSEGMKIGIKIEMLGWRACDTQFPEYSDSASRWWVKEVNIVPDSFLYRGEKYSIPEKERIFKIKKLYVNQRGVMMCEGKHPNVNVSKVCMGDLVINLAADLSNVEESLKSAEQLLDIINYDSAYYNDKREHLISVSTKCDIMSESMRRDGGRKLKENSNIRELSADVNDADDEEEVVVLKKPKNTSKIIKNNKGVVIAEITKDTLTEIQKTSFKRAASVSENVDMAAAENLPLVYVTEDIRTVEDLSIIQGDGSRRPVIFVAGPSSISQLTTSESEFSLGDSDLIRS